MQISWRVAFLIVAAAGAMHLSLWKVFVVLIGYLGLEQLDRRLSQRAKEKAIHDVMCGWKTSAEDLLFRRERGVLLWQPMVKAETRNIKVVKQEMSSGHLGSLLFAAAWA